MAKRDPNTEKMIEVILEKLRKLSPAYVRKVMLYTTSLLNIQEEKEVSNHA